MKKTMMIAVLAAVCVAAEEAKEKPAERLSGSFGVSRSETLRVNVINQEMDTMRLAVRFYNEEGQPLKASNGQALGGGLRVRSFEMTGDEVATLTPGLRPQIQVTTESLGSWDGSLIPGQGEYTVCVEVFETATGRGSGSSCKESRDMAPVAPPTKP